MCGLEEHPAVSWAALGRWLLSPNHHEVLRGGARGSLSLLQGGSSSCAQLGAEPVVAPAWVCECAAKGWARLLSQLISLSAKASTAAIPASIPAPHPSIHPSTPAPIWVAAPSDNAMSQPSWLLPTHVHGPESSHTSPPHSPSSVSPRSIPSHARAGPVELLPRDRC